MSSETNGSRGGSRRSRPQPRRWRRRSRAAAERPRIRLPRRGAQRSPLPPLHADDQPRRHGHVGVARRRRKAQRHLPRLPLAHDEPAAPTRCASSPRAPSTTAARSTKPKGCAARSSSTEARFLQPAPRRARGGALGRPGVALPSARPPSRRGPASASASRVPSGARRAKSSSSAGISTKRRLEQLLVRAASCARRSSSQLAEQQHVDVDRARAVADAAGLAAEPRLELLDRRRAARAARAPSRPAGTRSGSSAGRAPRRPGRCRRSRSWRARRRRPRRARRRAACRLAAAIADVRAEAEQAASGPGRAAVALTRAWSRAPPPGPSRPSPARRAAARRSGAASR